MTIFELARLVESMRAAQNRCFVNPRHWRETGANRLERAVDAVVKEILDAEMLERGEWAFEAIQRREQP